MTEPATPLPGTRLRRVVTLERLVDSLREREQLDAQAASELTRHLEEQEPTDSIVVLGLIGLGAWMAALSFMGFVGLTGFFDDGSARAVFGVVLVGLAIPLERPARHLFLRQLGTAFSLVGKICVVSIADDFDSACGLALLVGAIGYPFLREGLDRFITTVAVLALIAGSLIAEERLELVSLAALLALAVAIVLFTRARLTRMWRPLAYGLVTSAPLVLLLPASLTSMFPGELDVASAGYELLLTLPFAALFLLVCAWAAGSWTALVEPPLLVVSGAALLLGLASTPGILVAMSLLVLAFGRADRVLLGLGYLYLVAFLVSFYYQLDIDLLTKSGVLVASGLVLLGVYWSLRTLSDSRDSATNGRTAP